MTDINANEIHINTINHRFASVHTWLNFRPIFSLETIVNEFGATIAEQETNWFSQCLNGKISQLIGRHVAEKKIRCLLFFSLIVIII